MEGKEIIDKAITYITDLFRNNSDGHDVQHTIRVYENAMRIAGQESDCNRMVIALSALLHDVDDHKLFGSENNANARSFLKTVGVSDDLIEEICITINSVSFSQNRGKRPETIEGKIVQDADRLDAIGAIGIARTFSYGGKHGRTMEDSVQHFYDKLLLLKDELNTEAACEMAEDRHKFMEANINELRKETDFVLLG